MGELFTDASGLPEDDEPLLVSDQPPVDRYGNALFEYGEMDDTGYGEEGSENPVDTGLIVAPTMQSYFVSGLYNSGFVAGPQRPDDVIDEANPLPYWRATGYSGGAETPNYTIVPTWVDESNSPTGKAIKFSIPSGMQAAAGDSTYFEQIVPVMPRLRMHAPLIRSTTATNDPFVQGFISIDYLDSTGSAIGTAVSTVNPAWNDPQTIIYPMEVPSTARFLRFRFGCNVNLATNGPDEISMWDAYAGAPLISRATLIGFSDSVAANTSAGIEHGDLSLSGNAQRFITAGYSWVEQVGARVQNSRTAGNVDFMVRDVTTGSNVGPTATINGTYPDHRAEMGFYDISTNFIGAPDELRLRYESSAAWAPANEDALVHAVVATLLEDYLP